MINSILKGNVYNPVWKFVSRINDQSHLPNIGQIPVLLAMVFYTRWDFFCLAINILTMQNIIVAANIRDCRFKGRKRIN